MVFTYKYNFSIPVFLSIHLSSIHAEPLVLQKCLTNLDEIWHLHLVWVLDGYDIFKF